MDAPISLKDYSVNPKILDKVTPVEWVKFGKGDLHYGLEIEITYSQFFEQTDILRVPTLYIPGRFVWKEELSLENWGSELVLAPQTLAMIKGKSMRSMLSALRSQGADSRDSAGCGLHVHVDRAALLPVELKRIQYFFSYNSYFIKKYSGRSFESFKEWCRLPILPEEWNTYSHNPKDVAINTMHPDTIEFRIFAGTLSHSRIVAAVEFVDSLVWFSKLMTLDSIRQGRAFKDYLRFLCKGRSNPTLLADFEAHKITPAAGRMLRDSDWYQDIKAGDQGILFNDIV